MYAGKGICTDKLLHWSSVSHSSFYYKRSGKPKGIKPSTHTVNSDGELLENSVVVCDIEKTLHQEFCCYGYRNMSCELKEMGWIINHKKVYRLMKENHLLYGARIRPEPFKRNFIRFRSAGAEMKETYKKFIQKLTEQKDEILASFSHCSTNSSNLENFVETIVTFSSKLAMVWASSPIRVKENLQKLVFPSGISYDVKKKHFEPEVSELFL